MKTSKWKKVGIIFGILAIVCIAAVLIIPKVIDLNRYNDRIVSEIEKAIGGKATLGSVSWGISNGIWLEADDFSIRDATAFPADIEISRLYLRASILPLLTKKVELKEITVETPVINMRLEPSTTADQKTISPKKASEVILESRPATPPSGTIGSEKKQAPAVSPETAGSPLPVEISIEEVTISNGRIKLEDALTLPDQKIVRVFTDVQLAATNVTPGQEMAFNLGFREESESGLGTVKTQGTFSGLTESLALENPQLKLTAVISALSADTIKPYLKDSPLSQRLDGRVSLEVNYEGDLSMNHRSEGVIDLSQITYTDPSLWEAALPGAKTTLTYKAKLDPDDLTVEKIVIKLGNLSLNLSADVQSWNKRPIIKNAELSADLPLADLIPLIPWKQLGENADIIRSALEEGGKITIAKAVLSEFNPAEPPATAEAFLPKIDMTAQISGVSLQASAKIPKIENITGKLQLVDGVAHVESLTARVASVSLPEISAKITHLTEKPMVNARVQGRLQANEISDEDVKKLLRDLGLVKLVGAADIDLAVKLDSAQPEQVQLQGKVRLRDFQVKTAFTPALLEGLNADVAIEPDFINISNLTTAVVLPAVANSPGGRFMLELHGRIDAWRRQPVITLERLKTSPVSLPSLAPMVPWEKLGESAPLVKETLLAGGTVTIDDVALLKIDLSKSPKDLAGLLSGAKAAVDFADIAVRPSPTIPKIEGMTGQVTLDSGILAANNVTARLGPLTLPTLNIRATNIADHPKVSIQAKGPVRVAATRDASVEKLLRQYGLKSLTGSAEIDMNAEFDQRKPKEWIANGSLVLGGVRAETYPEAVVMDNLHGHVAFKRKKTMGITAENITAQINQAPIRMSGKLLNIGSPNLIVNAKAYAKQLDLAHLAELAPALKNLKLGGKLDMDVDAHLPYANLKKSKLNGALKTTNLRFQLAAQDLTVQKGNSEILLKGNAAQIKKMQMRVNDQILSIAGDIDNPVAPNVHLYVTSPNLNLDRLIPADQAKKGASQTSPKKESRTKKKPEKASKTELPPMARNLTAKLQINATQGQYKGLEFQKLKLNAIYERGVIKSYDISFLVDESPIATKGSANLRDLEHVTFAVDPDIQGLPLDKVAPLLGMDKLPVDGPFSLTGRLKGRTGSSKDLLSSLDGSLNAEIGPGRLMKIGRMGDLFASILALTSIKGLLSGEIVDNLESEGITFEHIKSETNFKGGNMNINNLFFKSDALNMHAQGTVGLLDEQLNMKAELVPLGTFDKILGFVPIVGKGAADLTKIYLDLEGPLENPKIRTRLTKGVATGVEDATKAAGKDVKKGTGFVEKGLEKIFGK